MRAYRDLLSLAGVLGSGIFVVKGEKMSQESEKVIAKIVTGIGVTIVMVFVIAGIGLLLAFPIKWTWNATMPYLLEAWCLNFLCGCLIKASHHSVK